MSDFEGLINNVTYLAVYAALVWDEKGNEKIETAKADLLSAIRALEEENAALKAANRWIPVGEREPNDSIKILCHDDVSNISWVGYFGDPVRSISHWYPLPPPPEDVV